MSTRKRNVSIQFYLNTREADLLDRKVKPTGLSRTAYLRHLVNGFQPRELPPPDYFAMMRELYRIGRNLNQIAQKAHALNVIDAQRYDEEVRKLEAAILTITNAVVSPMPVHEDITILDFARLSSSMEQEDCIIVDPEKEF